jgi:pyruvate-ferredoxin/flavodoxin oxidoreductase
MEHSMSHQKDAVKSGYWPLYRFHPSDIADGQPFKLDSAKPSMPVSEFMQAETRFTILAHTQPQRARDLAELAQADVDERWRYYEQLAATHRSAPHVHHGPGAMPEPTNGTGDDGKGAEA